MRFGVAVAVSCICAIGFAAGSDVQAAIRKSTNIPAQGLGPALQTLAKNRGFQVVYVSDEVDSLRTQGASGELTSGEALAQLLDGTGLTYRYFGDNAVGIVSAASVLSSSRIIERSSGSDKASARQGSASIRLAAAEGPETSSSSAEQGGSKASTNEHGSRIELEEIVVTGSHIRGVDSPSHVVTYTRDAIDMSGYATVAAALAALPQNFAGTTNEALNNNGGERQGTNNHFGTGLNLRGLGSDSTLVLINGRRMAGAGANGEFADISTIPTAAVDRVELLLDGASALYGSDAVGGVVNIVLKDRFDGAETRLQRGVATAGEPSESQAAQTIGGSWTGGSGLISYEYYERDVLHAADRDVTRDADLRRFGGTDRRSTFAFPGNILRTDPVTGTSAPFWAVPAGQSGAGLRPTDFLAGVTNLQNKRLGVDVLPKQRRHSLYLTAHQDLSDRVEISGDLRYGYRKYALDSGFNSGQVTLTPTNPFFVSPDGAASNRIQYAFVELPGAHAAGSTESLGTSIGADARLWRDWRVKAYGAYSREIGNAENTGLVNTVALAEASGVIPDRPDTTFDPAVDGYLNPLNGQPSNAAAVLAYIGGGYQRFRNRSTVKTLNVEADGSLVSLPGGKVQLAIGAQHREEDFARTGQNYITTATPVASAAVDVGRKVDAAFAELRVPVFGASNAHPGFQRLELSLAGRVEHYDDFGWTRNPKVGVLWSPVDSLLLRASYGRSFRAPGLRELSDAPSNVSSLLPVGTTRVGTLIQSGGNPDLDPETADSLTAGVEWRPTTDLGISVDWFDVKFKDRIDQPVRASIQTALSDPRVAMFVRRITPATNPTDRALIEALLADPATRTVLGGPDAYGAIVDARYVNTASLRVSGVDVSTVYRLTFGPDDLTFSGNLTHVYGYEQRLTPTSSAQDLVGVATYPVDVRARGAIDWRRGDLGAGLALNYTSGYEDALGIKIKALATVDFQLRYVAPKRSLLKGATATLNVRNLFDAEPPFYDNPAGIAYDAANGDPVGRFVSLQLTKTW